MRNPTRGTRLSKSPAEIAASKKKPRVNGVGGIKGRPIVWKCALAEKRFALRLTLRDVEAGCGVSTAVICAIEHGTDPMLTTAKTLAAFFGCTVDEMWPELMEKP